MKIAQKWNIALIVSMLLLGNISIAVAKVYTLLNFATATGAGSIIEEKQHDHRTWACDVVVTGSPTAVTVRIEGNQGRANFSSVGMAEHEFTADELFDGIAQFSIVDTPARKIRARVVTLAGGTNPTVSVVCTGVQ